MMRQKKIDSRRNVFHKRTTTDSGHFNHDYLHQALIDQRNHQKTNLKCLLYGCKSKFQCDAMAGGNVHSVHSVHSVTALWPLVGYSSPILAQVSNFKTIDPVLLRLQS
jgi:hypothetical protein